MKTIFKFLTGIGSIILIFFCVSAEGQTITSFTPTSGGTGNVITINGSGFTGTTNVSFGGINASTFTVVNDNVIHATVGNGQSGEVKVIKGSSNGVLGGFIYDAALPVSFVSFNSSLSENKIVLQWQIEDASDCDGFYVQRSEDGAVFSDIGFVKNDLKTSYHFTDSRSLKGNSYYRIKTQSISGVKTIYSTIIKSVNTFGTPAISVYPNPVIGKDFNVSISGLGNQSFQLQIINSSGRVVLEKNIEVDSDFWNCNLKLPASARPGMYTAQLMKNQKLIKSIQFVVLNKQ